MADRCRWDVSLDDEATVTVIQDGEDDIGEGQCHYRLTLESPESPPDLIVTSTTGGVTVTPEQHESDVEVVVTLPDDHGLSQVGVRHGDHEQCLFLPGSTLREQCFAAIDGDVDAARALLPRFDDPVQVPAMCGAFTDLREIGALIETLAGVNQYTAGRLHSYRYPLVRGTIISPVGLSVSTADELEALVEAIPPYPRIFRLRVAKMGIQTSTTVAFSEEHEGHEIREHLEIRSREEELQTSEPIPTRIPRYDRRDTQYLSFIQEPGPARSLKNDSTEAVVSTRRPEYT